VIDQMKADFPIAFLCPKFEVTASGFHAWKTRPVSARAVKRAEVDLAVLAVFRDSDRSAGYRKITQTLARDRDVTVDPKTVLCSMRRLQLMPPAADAAFRRHAARQRLETDPPDLLQRRFSPELWSPGTALVGDITYIPTGQGWLYVATVIDLATRKVLGWASSKRQTARLIVTALRRAINTGLVADTAIFHSDHGTQYRSKRFARFCAKHGIARSMGERFECWDNAVAESFFSRLKNERTKWINFATRAEAIREVAHYMRYWNSKRRHASIGYDTPDEALIRRRVDLTTAA
jgi:putative transposase